MTVALLFIVGGAAMVVWGTLAGLVCQVISVEARLQDARPCPDWSSAFVMAMLTAWLITSLAVVAVYSWQHWVAEWE